MGVYASSDFRLASSRYERVRSLHAYPFCQNPFCCDRSILTDKLGSIDHGSYDHLRTADGLVEGSSMEFGGVGG